MMQTIIEQFSATIRHAVEQRQPLCIRGSGSKDFYGGALLGEVVDTTPYSGVVSYEPQELVVTARAGTSLTEIEKLLADNGQMLPFEPPHFGAQATLGGCVAAGLSGPRRAYQGAVRDFVLGVRMLDGHGDDLKFGGQVMKNVAGYDVSRLMTGSLGTLGVLLEVSLKVLPRPAEEVTLVFEMDESEAIEQVNRWSGKPLPLSASCYDNSLLSVRLSGTPAAVRVAQQKMGGALRHDGAKFWQSVREHTLYFFQTDTPLWRISLPATHPPLTLPGRQLLEWGGAVRWLESAADAQMIRQMAQQAGGQATLFRAKEKPVGVFHPLSRALLNIHQRLKLTFDPHGIFNPGRMYAEF